jgi:hypothetical protein
MSIIKFIKNIMAKTTTKTINTPVVDTTPTPGTNNGDLIIERF